MASGQRTRRPTAAYARQKPASAAAPPIDPIAAATANDVPWSMARKNATGPDVRGSPTSHPPTPGPQRRAASVAPPISAGVRMSLKRRVGTR